MIKKKRASSLIHSNVVWIILSGIVAILIIGYIADLYSKSEYSGSLVACNLFFNNIDGKQAYWGETYDRITLKLENGIEQTCPSKEVSIDKDEISLATKLAKDCWFKTGEGVDIFGDHARDIGLCIYCGRVKIEEDINNFNELFSKEINKKDYENMFSQETEIKNLNEAFVDSVPKSMQKGEYLTIFYYTYQPLVSADNSLDTNLIENYLNPIINFVNKNTDFSTYTKYITPDVIDPFGSVMYTDQIKYGSDKFETVGEELSKFDCRFIVPIENFD